MTIKNDLEAQHYLHQIGELLLNDPTSGGFPPGVRLVAAARALHGVDLLQARVAQSIVDSYLARVSSTLKPSPKRGVSASDITPKPRHIKVIPIRPCPVELRFDWGRLYLHYASFHELFVSIEATAIGDVHGLYELWKEPLPIIDDAGSTVFSHLSGGASDAEWRGSLLTNGPLPSTTKWFTLGTSRVPVAPAYEHPPAQATRIGPSGVAERYLWLLASAHLAGRYSGQFSDALEPAAEAFLATGMLRANNRTLQELRIMSAVLPLSPGRTQLPSDLADPWRSVLDRWGEIALGAPKGVPIGVVIPRNDGIVVRLDGLVTTKIGFEIRVETSPGLAASYGRSSDVEIGPVIVWWARDDRGNYYVGRPGSGWALYGDHSRGRLVFQPALDPVATTLTILSASAVHGSSVSVPIPR